MGKVTVRIAGGGALQAATDAARRAAREAVASEVDRLRAEIMAAWLRQVLAYRLSQIRDRRP